MGIKPLEGMVFVAPEKPTSTNASKKFEVVQAETTTTTATTESSAMSPEMRALDKALQLMSSVEKAVEAIEKREKSQVSKNVKQALKDLRDIAHIGGMLDYDVSAINEAVKKVG